MKNRVHTSPNLIYLVRLRTDQPSTEGLVGQQSKYRATIPMMSESILVAAKQADAFYMKRSPIHEAIRPLIF